MNILDLTYPSIPGQTAGKPENHPTVTFTNMARYETAGFCTSSILLGSHIGTHMDAQKHFIQGGKSIDQISLDLCIGDITIVDYSHFLPGQSVNIKDLENIRITRRMMLVFNWDRFYHTPQYTCSWPHLSLEAAKYLIDNGVQFIATDVTSLDKKAQGTGDDFQIHKFMLKHDIIFVESLANTHLIDFNKNYYFIALPLCLKGLDGSPCRSILIEK